MPGHVPSAGMLITKLVSLFPHNSGTSLPTHQALILVFDPDTGEPLGLLDGTVITAVRLRGGARRRRHRRRGVPTRSNPLSGAHG